MLKGENLGKFYPVDVWALKNVNLEIKEGEIVGVMGPSGSGKSTLLHILATLDKPTEGRVFLNDREISNLSEKTAALLRNNNFGFIFQFYYLFPELNLLENIYLPLWLKNRRLGLEKPREKALALLNSVGLENKSLRFPFQLSGGEQQKVAICRSLICEPRIIFADEPTGNLDRNSTDYLLELILDLNEKGKTFVIASHNEKVLKIATKMLYLHNGQITDGPQ